MNIYLMPIGSKEPLEHMNDTLINSVSKDVFTQFLPENELRLVNEIYQSQDIFVWGLEPGKNNSKTWNNFSPDDIVIFVPSKEDLLITQITYKVKNEELAKHLWGTKNSSGQTWGLVFFLKIVSVLSLKKRVLLDELGFDEKDVLMGNRKVTERFISKYGSIQSFIHTYSDSEVTLESFSQESSEKCIDQILSREEKLRTLRQKIEGSNSSTEYVQIKGKRIKRNHLIVKYIKEKANYECESCGFSFIKKDGSKYVEVAHIEQLAASMQDTPENTVALCPNCHKKLDKGNNEIRAQVLSAIERLSRKSQA